ncbi:DnaD domain-containing protein [Lentibacillus sp.]|jgi:DNA replication protein|uniref:DnaD domain-containing protein n=1 Tax=Lentibacillus sp. TaxID=1925746 RepID=UPI002B4B6B4F|nr:DnaD domain-containing protein [Lentibacillus sp.]HLS08256.1 DnaD domain-containing protein [Lentibacillus sp.]
MTRFISFQDILLNQIQVPVQLLDQFTTLGLKEQEVMVIIQLLRFQQEKNDFPTPNDLASHLTISEKECANILRRLIQKNFLSIEQLKNEANQITESYSLNPLWEKLFAEKQEDQAEGDGTIFILFEQEFGRPLSPFEIEMINTWLDEDELAPALIKAALRESVLMGKLNFKYIDRILREWKKKGIHTVEQARNASKAFHEKQAAKKDNKPKKRDTSIYYNWLEEE